VSSSLLREQRRSLLGIIQRAVEERCRALGAVSSGSLVGQLPALSLSGVTCAGFLQLPLDSRRSQSASAGRIRVSSPRIVIAGTKRNELEVHRSVVQAADCRCRLDTRLLVILPGSPGARERMATLIRQAVDPEAGFRPAERMEIVQHRSGARLPGPCLLHTRCRR